MPSRLSLAGLLLLTACSTLPPQDAVPPAKTVNLLDLVRDLADRTDDNFVLDQEAEQALRAFYVADPGAVPAVEIRSALEKALSEAGLEQRQVGEGSTSVFVITRPLAS